MSKQVTVAFSVNNDYVYYGYLAIYSLIKRANSITQYNIVVFVNNLKDKNISLLESLSNNNIIVECIDISGFLAQVHLEESLHLSIETYYRLFIPLVLPHAERVLYLDSDLVVLEDILELYFTDMCGKAVAVVPDVFCGILKRHSQEIGNLDYKNTFNAGVLLMDTRRFEEEHIRDKCLNLLEEDYKRKERKLIFADQDALNIVLYNSVTFLDSKWNCQYQYAWRVDEVDEEYRKQYLEDLDHAAIIHYAGTNKPWMFPLLPKADIFWNIAKETPVFLELLETVIETSKKGAMCVPRKRYLFPFELIPYNSKVGLYGAGRIGQEFYSQIKESMYAEITIWVDRNADELADEFNVKTIDSIDNSLFDYIVIAVKNSKAANEIRELLLNKGVDKRKIVWKHY